MEYKRGDIVLFGTDSKSCYPAVVKDKLEKRYIVHVSRQTMVSIAINQILENPDNIKPKFNEKDIKMALKSINYYSTWNNYVLKQLILTSNMYDLQILNKFSKSTNNELVEMIINKGISITISG